MAPPAHSPLQTSHVLVPSPHNYMSSASDQNSPPMSVILSRQQLNGNITRRRINENSHNPSNAEMFSGSIFSHRLQAKAKKQRMPDSSPVVISLLSTPESSVNSPQTPIRSIPMKDRIAPAKKPAHKPKNTSNLVKGTVNAIKKNDVQAAEEFLDPESRKQKRAAELIITKELKGAEEAMDLDLFGEVVPETKTTEEAKRKDSDLASEVSDQHIADTIEIMEYKEAAKIREIERLRILAQQEERERLEKKAAEHREKARREAIRKKQAAEEEAEKERRRQKAADRIEMQRKEDEERERANQEADERAKKIQSEAEELAKLKAKQEEAKKQAISLSAAKIPMPDDKAKGSSATDVAMEQEESLFVPNR